MICKPYKECKQTQITKYFSDNHQAVDFAYKLGTALVAPADCIVENIEDANSPHEMNKEWQGGWGIRLKSTRHDNMVFVHWHCTPFFPVKVGDFVKQGDFVAQMGNSGDCVVGGKLLTFEEKMARPDKGVHDHFIMMIDGIMVNPLEHIDWGIEIKESFADILKKIVILTKKFLEIKVK